MRSFLPLLIPSVLVFGLAAPAHAIDSCRARVDKKTGVIRVDASGAAGAVLWGPAPGSESNAFFNDASCADGDTLKKCELADPATVAAKTPPAGCTLYLDDGTQPCQLWISGCTPGLRDLAVDLPQLQADLAQLQADLAALQMLAVTHGGQITTLQGSLATAQADITALEATTTSQGSTIATHGADIAALQSSSSAQGSDIAALQDSVTSQDASLSTLNDKTQCLTSTATDVWVSNCNLHVVSGSGATDGAINGRGNLIVGYDESLPGTQKTGSHNLVVGRWHGYSSWGGLVAGEANAITAPKASVTGGTNNGAAGIASSVTGGYLNAANAHFSTITGGAST